MANSVTPSSSDPMVAMRRRMDQARQSEQKQASIQETDRKNEAIRTEQQQTAVRQGEQRQEAAKTAAPAPKPAPGSVNQLA